ncbi:MAG TPA: hypothetical protein VNJ05_09950, partial [Sphingomicrobium sp.]|nr:hypothetical protein [Sphingomicrobium sp.]
LAGVRDAAGLAALLHPLGNDLAAAATALAPQISRALKRLAADRSCLLARVSGSGATCFGLFADEAAARAAATAIAAERPGWWVAATRFAEMQEATPRVEPADHCL